MKTDSPEYKALMRKWSDEAWEEELARAVEESWEHEDAYGSITKPDKDLAG